MRLAIALLTFLPVLHAHVVSMSSAELVVQGLQATYELHMPIYEIAHVSNPQTALFEHVSFKGAERKSGQCEEQQGYFVCKATFEFAAPVPDKLDATCTLFQVTVPNHVHLLHATQGSNGDQVVFDQRFTDVEVRFRPPSPTEKLVRDSAAGMSRLWFSVSGVIFLLALALAARSWNDVSIFAALFLGAEWIAVPLAPQLPLSLSSGFLEAAMALTGAYLAVDVLLLPEARSRWGLIPLMGLVHGLYYAAFPAAYLVGASVAQAIAITIFAAITLRLGKPVRRALMIATLIASLGWFAKLMLAPTAPKT
jgi:hypothetical protein